jgi:hypothetical protein
MRLSIMRNEQTDVSNEIEALDGKQAAASLVLERLTSEETRIGERMAMLHAELELVRKHKSEQEGRVRKPATPSPAAACDGVMCTCLCASPADGDVGRRARTMPETCNADRRGPGPSRPRARQAGPALGRAEASGPIAHSCRRRTEGRNRVPLASCSDRLASAQY